MSTNNKLRVHPIVTLVLVVVAFGIGLMVGKRPQQNQRGDPANRFLAQPILVHEPNSDGRPDKLYKLAPYRMQINGTFTELGNRPPEGVFGWVLEFDEGRIKVYYEKQGI